MTPSQSRPIIRTVLAASALMLLWMGRAIIRGEVPLTGDLLQSYYPFRDFYAQALAAGQRFDWMPSLLGGFDFTGASQNGGYHPAHWLLYRFVPINTAFAVEMVAPYPLAFAGMWVFLRQWCAGGAAAVGAMLFAFSGFTLLRGIHPNIMAIFGHLPWLLWCVHEAVRADSWRIRARWCAGIAALTGSQLLLDHPQAVWLSALIEALYLLFLIAVVSPAPRRWPGAGTVAAGKMLGLLVGTIQVMATLHASGHSTRAGVEAEFAYQHSMPLWHLLQLVNPYLVWGRVIRWSERAPADEYAVYVGAVTLLLVVWWLAALSDRRTRGALTTADRFGLWAVGVAVLGLWLAAGRAGGLYTLQTILPVVDKFRVPLRFVLFTYVAVACAAAVAFARLARMARDAQGTARTTVAIWALTGLSIVASILATVFAGGDRLPRPDSVAAVAFAPAMFAVAAALLTRASRGSRPALVALVVVAAADQAVYGLGGVVAWQEFGTRAEIIRQLGPADQLPPPQPHRLACCAFPNVFEVAGYRVIEGYVGLEPVRQLSYHSTAALRLAQVGFVHRSMVERLRIRGVEAFSRDWYRIPLPLPRAWLVTGTRISAHPAEDVEQLDLERVAIASHGLGLTEGEPGTVSILRDEPGVIDVRTRSSGRQLLVVSEMYEHRWTASIDGVPVSVERVNGDFLGCVVPAGVHQVHFEFHPRYREVGGPISLAGSAIVGLLAIVGAWQPRAPRRRLPVESERRISAAQR